MAITGTGMMMTMGGALLSLLIAIKMINFGFPTVMFFIMINYGIDMFLIPLLGQYVPKICWSDPHAYASTSMKLLFYMMVLQMVDYSKIYTYIILYGLGYAITMLTLSFIFCKDVKKKK